MIIGWLEDPPELVGFTGGAELDALALRESASHEIALMPPEQVEAGADAYVVANCVFYTSRDIDQIDGPIIKIVNDSWTYSQPYVRDKLLDRADLTILRSPLHQERFTHAIRGAVELLPSPVDLEPFRAAKWGPGKRPRRAVWLATTIGPARTTGLKAARKWAEQKEIPLDEYGVGTNGGEVPYDDVPGLLASYRWYVHAMGRGSFEPFGRTTVEAWAAGCNLAVNDQIGALYWIHERPDDLERATDMFWDAFNRTMDRCLSSVS